MAVNMGTAIAYLELDTSKFSKGFTSAYNDLKVFGSSTATAEQKMRGLSSAFKTTGSVLTKNVTVPLVGVGAVATKTTMEFESGMSKVQAISGATGKEVEQLKKKAIEMGAKTKFSASEAAEAFSYMAMAGWKTGDMLDGIEGVMNLAAASGEDLASTSDIVTDALTAFGLSAKDSAHFADVLAKASSNSNTNVGLMGETFKYLAPVAGALGYSVEDCAVAIGLMANSGIKASQAGTSLRSLLTNLAKPTEQVADAMEEYNISLTDSQGNMKPMSELVNDLRDRFSGLTESEKTNLAATLAGKTGMSGLLAIVNASDEDFQKLTESINNADGAAEDMANTMLDNASGAVTILKSTLESAAIVIGTRLTPYIRKLAESITRLVEKFNNLSDEQQDSIVRFGLIVAAIGPVLLILSKIISVVVTVVNVFRTFGTVIMSVKTSIELIRAGYVGLATAMGGIPKIVALISTALSSPVAPILAIVAVIGTLVAAFVHLWNTSKEFKTFWVDLWGKIKGAVSNAIDAIKTFFLQTIPQVFNSAMSVIKKFVDSIVKFFTSTLPQTFNNFVNKTLPNAIKSIINWFAQLPYNIGFAIGSLIGYFYLFGTNLLSWIKTELPKLVNNIINWFAQLPSKIKTQLDKIIKNIVTWGTNMYKQATTSAKNFVNEVVKWISNLPSKVQTYLTNTISKVTSWGSNMISKAKSTASDFVSDFVEKIKSLPTKVSDIIGKIPAKVTAIGGELKQAGRDIFNKLFEGIKSVGNSIVSWVSNFASKVKNAIKGIIDGFSNVVSSADSAKSAAKSVGVDGSHANGLDYVPYNGYVAELHEGERVLTKEQNKDYNNGNSGNGNGDTFNFYNVKPDPYEYARQMKKAKKDLLYGF